MITLPFGTMWSNRSVDGTTFKNIGPTIPDETILDNVYWACNNCWRCLPGPPKEGYEAFGAKWYKPCNIKEKLRELRSDPSTKEETHAFWIGHATTLVCLPSGTNIMFDPIFSYRASPFSWAGPPRKFPPSVTYDQLPNIDIITLSHNHYDHFDEYSVRQLYKRFPQVKFITPLRLGETLVRWGIPESNITQMDWWEELRIKDVVVGCTPAHHWGQHFAFDRNEQLWCGWCIGWSADGGPIPEYKECEVLTAGNQTDGGDQDNEFSEGIVPGTPTVDWMNLKSYYFTGDTAFNEPMFHLIHRRFPRIDMAALPIGAYAPRWYMYNAHIDPDNEAKVFNILKPRQAFAVHWATFELSDEPLDEPCEVLAAAKALEGIPEELFLCIPIGTYMSF